MCAWRSKLNFKCISTCWCLRERVEKTKIIQAQIFGRNGTFFRAQSDPLETLKPEQMVGTQFGSKTAAESGFNYRTSKIEIGRSQWMVTIDSGPQTAWRSGLIIWIPGLGVPRETGFLHPTKVTSFPRVGCPYLFLMWQNREGAQRHVCPFKSYRPHVWWIIQMD